jgi:hypothetical protein
MDQAPAALSNIFGSAFNEIRDEVNELKQSNTSLLKKTEALEAGQTEFRKLTDELTTTFVDLESRAETSEKELKESCTNVTQLEKVLYRVALNAATQKKVTDDLRVSLAEAQNEIAALKLHLTAKDEGLRCVSPLQHAAPWDVRLTLNSIGKGTKEVEQAPQPKDAAVKTADEQPTEFFSFTSPHPPPHFIREPSVESLMTFCNAEQSVARRKHRAVGLQDRAVPTPPELQVPMARPDGSVFIKNKHNKRRKMTATQDQAPGGEESSLKSFTMPVLSNRPGAGKKSQPTIPGFTEQSPNGENSHESRYTCNDDVDMEDNIVVAPRQARTAFALAGPAPVSGMSASPTMSQFGRVADEVLRDLDVRSSTESTSHSRPSNPTGASNLAIQPTSQSSTAGTSQVAQGNLARDNPDVTDLDTGFQHQPSNRGENDQTGVVGERLYQTVKLDNGNLYTVDRSRAHANKVQPWKSWAVKKNGVWFQWASYSTLDWADRAALTKMNNWREQAFARAEFPKKRQGRWDGTAVQTQAPLESEPEKEEQPGKAATLDSQVTQPPPNSITRTHLLSQFQARTGEMQKGSRSQSAEQSE